MEQKYLLRIKTRDLVLEICEIENFVIKSPSRLPKVTSSITFSFTPKEKQWVEESLLENWVEQYIDREIVLYRDQSPIYRGLINAVVYSMEGDSVVITIIANQIASTELESLFESLEFKPVIKGSGDYKSWNIN